MYEVGFHLLPTVPEEKLEEVVSSLQSLITKDGGMVVSEEFPKIRQLAYDIKKRIDIKHVTFSKAYFGWIKFVMDPSGILELKKRLDLDPNLIRFLILKTVKIARISTPLIYMQ